MSVLYWTIGNTFSHSESAADNDLLQLKSLVALRNLEVHLSQMGCAKQNMQWFAQVLQTSASPSNPLEAVTLSFQAQGRIRHQWLLQPWSMVSDVILAGGFPNLISLLIQPNYYFCLTADCLLSQMDEFMGKLRAHEFAVALSKVENLNFSIEAGESTRPFPDFDVELNMFRISRNT